MLEDYEKPHIIIFHNEIAPVDFIAEINYPYIEFFHSKKNNSVLKRILNHYSSNYFNKFLFKSYPQEVDVVFPSFTENSCFKSKKFIHWKADFQEKYFAQYFTKNDIKYSNYFFKNLKKHPRDILVLSSYDAKNDFNTYYPELKNPTEILRFVSFLPSYEHINISKLKEKFQIRDSYFIVCNQFWPHKNHIRVLEALAILKNQGKISFQIVFTGTTSSHRSNTVFDNLKQYVEAHNLYNDVVITGFLQREEQLTLIKNSRAIIQPTYFEGWSTVIEDAKALNHYVIASNINVNIEQIDKNVTFFHPDSAEELAEILKDFSQTIEDYNYNNDIEIYVEKLRNLLTQ